MKIILLGADCLLYRDCIWTTPCHAPNGQREHRTRTTILACGRREQHTNKRSDSTSTMAGPTFGRRKRGRVAPLRCHVVDDHCDALRHIHAAIRQGTLPFTDLRMMHWDAHPDLMVTPDMPAATCFSPHDLYHTLEAAEGGIAEWILPLVYQVGQAGTDILCTSRMPKA